MKPVREWSGLRVAATLAACAALGVLLLQGIERLAPPPAPPREASGGGSAPPPPSFEVRREGPGGVIIEWGGHQRSTIHMQEDSERADRLAACIREAIERLSTEPGPQPTGDEERVIVFGLRIEVPPADRRIERAVQECMARQDRDAEE